MTRQMEKISKREYIICEVTHKRALKLVATHHYAGGMSNTASHVYGLFRKDQPLKLLGVSVWMNASAGIAIQYGEGAFNRVLTLSRFVLVPDLPKNAASLLLGASIRSIRRLNRYICLVTFADTSENHIGTIYRATNWEYIGLVKGAPRYKDSNGRLVSIKSKVTKSASYMRSRYRFDGYSKKHKFIYRLKIKKQTSKQLTLFDVGKLSNMQKQEERK